MGNNPFKHVRSGERLEFPATAYNAMLDAAEAHRNRRMNLSPGKTGFDSLYIHVVNETGKTLKRFDVIGLDGPFNTTDLDTFCERIVFRGVIPEKTHSDRFAIIQQDAEPDICVRAVISGPSIARIDVEKEPESLDGLTCRAIEGETDLLELGGGGAAVLWIDRGSGERWAIILLGASTVTIHVGEVSGEIKPGTDPDNEEHGGTVVEESNDTTESVDQRAFAGMLVDEDTIEKGTRVEWLRIGGVNRIINADCKGSDDEEDKDEEGKTTSE